MSSLRRLGRTDLQLSSIGLGCWQFSEGFGFAGGFWPALPSETVDAIVARSLAGGVNWFDTAEVYGKGRSERALALALTRAGKHPGDVRVATKWMPSMRFASSAKTTMPERIDALRPFPVDLHQVHMPVSFSTVEAEMDVFAELVRSGQTKTVGVSNFSASKMRRAHAALAKHGIPLASNQIRYSLLDRKVEANGILAAAKELGVTLIAYSPLEQGLLSGKFHDDPTLVSKLQGLRRFMPWYRSSGLRKSQPLIDELKAIAQAHSVTPSQVALAWLLQFHGDTVVAIPGATKEKHAEENVGAMSLKLTPDELRRIDEKSRRYL